MPPKRTTLTSKRESFYEESFIVLDSDDDFKEPAPTIRRVVIKGGGGSDPLRNLNGTQPLTDRDSTIELLEEETEEESFNEDCSGGSSVRKDAPRASDNWKSLMEQMQLNQKKLTQEKERSKLVKRLDSSKSSKRKKPLVNSPRKVSNKRGAGTKQKASVSVKFPKKEEPSPFKKLKFGMDDRNNTLEEADSVSCIKEKLQVVSVEDLRLVGNDEEDSSSNSTSYQRNSNWETSVESATVSVSFEETASTSFARQCTGKIPEMFLPAAERLALMKTRQEAKCVVREDLSEALKSLSREPDFYSSASANPEYFDGNIVKLNCSSSGGVNAAANEASSVKVKNKPKTCPFYKKLPDTRFAVDAFNYGEIPGIEVYFLSHFHSDHYIGLTKKFSKTLICSPPTANLAQMKLGVEEKCIRRLQVNQPYVVDGTEVTLLHANHCPGSVMFIFRLPNGVVYFHTGDFRFTEEMLSCHVLQGLKIDNLYLDTTYCDPQYNFPTQADAIAELIAFVKGKLEARPKTLIVCGSYVIGKERVYMSLAEAIGTKVFMNYEKRRVIRALENPKFDSYLTDKEEEAAIHVHQMFSINPKFLQEYLTSLTPKFTNIIGVKPTGWQFASSGDTSTRRSFYGDTVSIIGIPYSEHSSFSELERFVSKLKPLKVQPTVNVGNAEKRDQMNSYINKWLQSPTVPE